MFRRLVCLAAVCLVSAMAGNAVAQELGKGNALFEFWFNISGTSVDLNLRTDPDFPDHPDSSEWRTSLEGPVNLQDNYGERARAYLTPPVDGDYTFWVAGDDNCQLWLSTDDNADNATMIAQVPGWTNSQEWTKYPEQKSAPMALHAGQKYYIEMLSKEGGGGDSLAAAWAGPGVGDNPTVISGLYLTAFIRNPEPLLMAQNPDPANGAVDVTNPLLTWKAGITAKAHNVYFGTSPTLGPDQFAGRQPIAAYYHLAGFEPGVTYYWRVDEIDDVNTVFPGNVWSFTTTPLTAHFPDPYNGAQWRKTDLRLAWAPGLGAVSHSVFLSESEAALTPPSDEARVADRIPDAFFDVTGLKVNSKYYWRVDEVDFTGAVQTGPVWEFTTIDPNGGAIAEYWDNMTLSGPPKIVKMAPEINFNWPGSTPGVDSPDPAIPVDGFSCRWSADLNVPVSGEYVLYEASDDGARLFLNGEEVANGWYDRGTTEDATGVLNLVAGGRYTIVMEMYENTGGATASLRWSGPGIPKEIIPQGALVPPKSAYGPKPSNGATDVPDLPTLSWGAGTTAVSHDLFLGTDPNAVAAADPQTYQGRLTQPTFTPAAPLTWNATYYWRVDEVQADGSLIPGPVWSFTVINFLVVSLEETAVNYDNTRAPFLSEVALDVPSDWTINGITNLLLRFQGRRGPVGGFQYDEATQTYTVLGAGADIWDVADQFEYVYAFLSGDGSITAKVDSLQYANDWSKAGVMIRETLDAGSRQAFCCITPANGVSFQNRVETNQISYNSNTPGVAAPYWVRLVREGNVFSAYRSADGVTWELQPASAETPNPREINMAADVLIGLAVTSHVDAATTAKAEISNVSTTGNVLPPVPLQFSHDIPTNDPQPVFVRLEDKAGASASVMFRDLEASTLVDWWNWEIRLSEFTGVDLTSVAKLYLGVGNVLEPRSDGTGVVLFDNIRVVKPTEIVEPADVTRPGDNLRGVPNDGDWPAPETPSNAIDNDVNTKYLHFKGETEPTGFQVEVDEMTIVNELTFTTANDAPERDPVKFELYGATDGIDGPYTLIASGDITDFATETAWPRFTKNDTPITFENEVAYKFYQVMFPAVRDPATANSMQIAEVELIGTTAP